MTICRSRVTVTATYLFFNVNLIRSNFNVHLCITGKNYSAMAAASSNTPSKLSGNYSPAHQALRCHIDYVPADCALAKTAMTIASVE